MARGCDAVLTPRPGMVARTGGAALLAAMSGWGASSIIAVAYAPKSMALASVLLPAPLLGPAHSFAAGWLGL